MNDSPRIASVEELDRLFKESFPDIRCLRCGNDEFYILPSARQVIVLQDGATREAVIPVMTVACTRCGHVEQHLLGALRDAVKPILIEGRPAS